MAPNARTPAANDLRVLLSEDRMVAELAVTAGFPTSLLTVDACAAAFSEKGVIVRKPQLHAIEHQIELARAAPDRDHVIRIEGIAPRHGLDGEFRLERRFVEPAPPPPDGEERIDFYAQSRHVSVRQGDVVGELRMPTRGDGGVDVTGRARPARPGRPASLRIDRSLAVDPAGQCVAQFDGVLVHQRGTLRIDPLLTIKGNVDFSTGNIDVDAAVEVVGSVMDRFAITTPRSVRVRQLIEGAVIRAGGDLIASGGMAGKLKGRLDIGGDLVARYLDNVVARVAGDALVEREIVNTHLDVGGSLRMPAGTAVAASIYAGQTVVIGDLGNPVGKPTTLGIDAPRPVGDDGQPLAGDPILTVNRKLHAGVILVVGGIAYRFHHGVRGPLWVRYDVAGRLVLCDGRSGTCTRLCRLAQAHRPPHRQLARTEGADPPVGP